MSEQNETKYEKYLKNAEIENEEILKNNPYIKKIHDKNLAYKSNLTNLISEMNKELGVTITTTVGRDEMFNLMAVEFRDESGTVFFKSFGMSSIMFNDEQDWEEDMIFRAKCRYKDIYPTKLKSDN